MNNILIQIGNVTIYWYSVLILLAIIIGTYLVIIEAPRRGLKVDYIKDLIFYLVIVAIIGARVYYVIFNFTAYRDNPLDIFKIWEGGLAIYGGIIAGIIFIFFYARYKKQSVIDTMDVMVPSLILGQAIGRWGNFFHREAYGVRTSLAHLRELHIPNFIIDNMFINGHYYTPTFLYESLLCLMGFAFLMIIRKKTRKMKGMQVGIYFIFYGIVRFFIEGLRMDSLYFRGYRVSQIVSIILIVIGITIVLYNIINSKKRRDDNV